ncbi:tandem-95 repeat protein [Dokdonella sp.]|uniref:tandem-95 repeat protein n=1 Tax=Dokdonella sp. TaxID=2291710 RepID=UPI003BB21147
MNSKSKGLFALLLAAFCLFGMAPGAFAQSTYDYSVYVDADANPGSGCTVGLVNGADVRLRVTASGGLTPQVVQVTRARCAGGAFGGETVIAGSSAVGADNGVAGSDVIELSDALSQLSQPGAPSLVFFVVATSATGEDVLISSDGTIGGPPIGFGLAALAIPMLGIPALILLALLVVLVGARIARRRGLLRVAAMIFLCSGIALAANFVVDGQVGDWSGVAPLATDPAGDSSSGESAIDLRAFFAAIENDRVFMRIDVTNLQNNAPTALAGSASTLEDQTVTLTLTGTDNENDTLSFAIVTAPTQGSLGAITPTGPQSATVLYTPNADANGSDSFTFSVNDGQATSAAANVAVTITPVNDVPSFNAGANQVINEDAPAQSVTAWASAILAGPANEAGQALDFIVSNDNNALFSVAPVISATGALTYTAAANANGVANVTVSLHDNGGTANGGIDTSAAQTFTITVNSVNDAPSFTKGPDQTVLEGAAAQNVDPWATAIAAGPADESAQVLSFAVSNDNNALFSVQPAVSPSGALTYTVAAGANGSALVTLSLGDDGGTANGGIDTSVAQTFTITVTGINDAPSFSAGPNQIVLEDAGAQTINPWATAISAGPPNESGQLLDFIVSNDNNALFSAQPAVSPSGALTYTPAANANGSATVTLSLHDDGGTANGGVDTSPSQTFTITVTAVNDAPSFLKGADQTVLEDAPAQAIAGWATAISAGPVDESAQTLAFAVTANSNPTLFSVAPSVSATGNLSYTPAANANGSATITLSLADNGGTANGGLDTSAAQTFVINVTSVNDAPVFTRGADQAVAEDAGAQTVNSWATAISAGPPDESTQTLTFNVGGNTNPALFSVAPAISASGILTYTPAADANGTATISLALADNGGTANGGIDTSPTQTFVITVTAVNDLPVLDLNGPAAGNDFATTYTEADPAVAIVDPAALSLTDVDSTNLAGATISISNLLDGALESLAASTAGTSIVAAYNSGTGVLALSGSDSTANYQAVLRTVTYLNTSTAPNETARVVGFVANDGTGNSNVAFSTVSVVGVNTVPSFTAGAAVSINEDAGAQAIANWATSINDNDGGLQTLNFTVTQTGGSLVFSVPPAISATGNLSFTAAADASGTASFDVVLVDSGSNNNTSAAQTLTITVNAVNDAPSFVKGGDQTVLEDAGAQSVPGWASAISPGPADESGQSVSFAITGNTNAALFSAAPAIAANGTLTYTAAANANGTATISVSLSDNGGTANGGSDTSAVQTFVINVTAVNDIPGFSVGADQALFDDAGAVTVNPWATGIFTGPANEAGQSISFVIDSNSAASAFAAGPSVSATGVLSFTPAIVPSGTPTLATISLHVLDDGGTANGGQNASLAQSFTIEITHRNAPPVLTNPTITYATAGNTQLQVAGAAIPGRVSISDAQSALAKSAPTDPDGPVAPSVVDATGNSANGGNYTIDAAGAFSYVPPAGFSGTDTFTFTVTDGNTPTPGTVVGTINITVGPVIWYIDNLVDANNPGAGSDGRSNNAFETLAAAQTASGAGAILFVFNGVSATTPYTGGIVLQDGQRLWGEGYGLAVAPFGTLVAAGTRPRINAASADAVSIPASAGNRVGVEVRGLDLQGNPNAIDVTATGANNVGVTIAGNNVRGAAAEGFDINLGSTGTQRIAIQNNAVTATGTGIDVNRTLGTATITAFNDNTISGASGGTGIMVNGAIFDATPGNPIDPVSGGVTTIGAVGNGVGASGMLLSNVIGELSFIDLDIVNDAGSGLVVSSTGALNASAGSGFRIAVNSGVGSIDSIAGPAIDVNNASVSLPLGNVQSASSTTTGISLVNAFGGPGSIAFLATSGQITDPNAASGTALRVDGGNGNVNYPGAITSKTGNAVVIANRGSDTVTLSGTITESGTGILLNSNSGATINFSGALSLSTGINPAFTAIAGGTVSATHTASTAATTIATAINVANTTIGAAGLNFRSVSAGTGGFSAGSGIVLDNTGASGRLIVTGNTVAGSGGRIQHKDIGISLSSTLNPSFSWMQLNDFNDFAIRGQTVNGFSLANTAINGTNGNSAAADEGSVRFGELTGSVSITNSGISGGFEDNFKLVNTSGSLNRLTFDNTTIGSNSLSDGNDGVTLEAAGTAIINVTVQNSTFTSARGDLFQFNHIGSGTGDLVLTNNEFSNNFPAIATGGGGLSLFTSGLAGSSVTMNITGNSFRDAVGPGVLIVKSEGPGTLTGTFANNTIGVAGTPNSGSAEGSALKLQTVGQGTMSWNVTNNQIRGYNNFGIEVLAGGGATPQGGIVNTNVTGNLIAEPGNTPGTLGVSKNAIHYNIGTVVGDTYQACANIGGAGALANEIYLGGKDAVPPTGFGDIDFRIRNRRTGVNINLPGYAGPAAASDATINAYLVPRNSQGGAPVGLAHGVTGTYSGTGVTCP